MNPEIHVTHSCPSADHQPILPQISVILVEDDHELREALTDNLRLNGLNVTETSNAQEFRSALKSCKADVAIVDINLPDASGFEIARQLSTGHHGLGIIVLTARTGQNDRIKGYAEGADIYMTKPVDGKELLFAIRNLARRLSSGKQLKAAGTDADATRSVAWRLDRTHRLLIAPDRTEILLTGREVLLLEQFQQSAHSPLSRACLSEVMGYGEPGPNQRGLDAALKRLRDKVSDKGKTLPVLIIQNIGLKFTAPLLLV